MGCGTGRGVGTGCAVWVVGAFAPAPWVPGDGLLPCLCLGQSWGGSPGVGHSWVGRGWGSGRKRPLLLPPTCVKGTLRPGRVPNLRDGGVVPCLDYGGQGPGPMWAWPVCVGGVGVPRGRRGPRLQPPVPGARAGSWVPVLRFGDGLCVWVAFWGVASCGFHRALHRAA